MTVGDLDFKLSISGADNVQEKIEDINDELLRLQSLASTLDGKDIDIKARIDRDGSLSETVQTAKTLGEVADDLDGDLLSVEDTEIGLGVDRRELRNEIKAAVEAGSFTADVDADVDTNLVGSRLTGELSGTDIDRDSTGRLGRISSALEGQSLAEDLSRLNDEAFAVASILSKLPSALSASVGAFAALAVGATAAVGAVGGLAAAATGLATKFGDQQLRQSLTRLQVLFEGVARDFVESFQEAGIFENQLFPAARKVAAVLEDQIPVLTEFTKNNLPSLVDAVIGLVEAIDDVVFGLDKILSLFDLIFEGLEVLAEAPLAFGELFLEDIGFGDAAPDFFREALEESFKSGSASAANLIGRDLGPGDGTNRFVGERNDSTAGDVEGGSVLAQRLLGGREASGFEDVPIKATEKLRELQIAIQKARRKEEELATFTEKDLQKSLVQSYQKGVNKLFEVEAQTGQLPAATDDWIRKLEEAQGKLDRIGASKKIEETVGDLERASKVEAAPLNFIPNQFNVESNFGLGQLRAAAESADSIRQINTLIQQARQQFDLLANREALQFVGRLQKAKQELKEMRGVSVDASLDGFNRTLRESVRNAASLGERLGNAVTRFTDQLSQGIGQSVGDALFADRGRLNRLRGRRRQIQQNLRQARQAGNVQQIRQLSSELDRVNQKLNQSETLAGRLGQAFRNFGQVAKQALESFVSQLVQAIAKIAALKIISSFLTGGASIPSATGLPGAGLTKFIPGAASGGFVQEGGLARIHKGEHIIPKGGGMGTGQLDAGTASLNGDTIEIPVRMINDGNRIGSRNKGRAGRA